MRAMRLAVVVPLLLSLEVPISLKGQELQQKSPPEVLAIVDGKILTRAELESKEAAKLLPARDQYYKAQREALDRLIDDALLEMQAQRENLTVPQLLEKHVTSKVKDPTDDQLEVYYEGVQTDQPFAAVRDKILETIRQRRIANARKEYLNSLRNQANLEVLLASPSVDVALGDGPTRGTPNAPVLLIEFADYECPYCQKINADLKKLEADYSGKVLFAFKDFPLPMHKHAQKASEAARCAGLQDKYWEYHDLLFQKGNGLEISQLKEYARTLKLDAAKFDQCLDSGDAAAAVKKDQEQGQKLGLTGTPSFFVNGHFFSGAATYTMLREIVDQQLTFLAASQKRPAGGR
jgi:predicted DsbA family dithiol-disulfide isomerase